MTVALGASMILIRQCAVLIVDLREARADLARLAVDAERLRFARDLHDGLGHSLSVIALQAQVARRLMTSDPAAASASLVEVERVSHESLAALRETVSGYRQPRLADELEGARDVLAAAGIELEIVRQDDPLPESSDRLLAWAVREGVTNVLRHSRAHACRIVIDQDDRTYRLELCDDGIGGSAASAGSGLAGLRERMSMGGGEVVAGPEPGGGFRLSVRLPVGPA
jgi:two-component system sensor histidine kinase DesK